MGEEECGHAIYRRGKDLDQVEELVVDKRDRFYLHRKDLHAY